MSDEKQEWQVLIPELLKDWWHTNDAFWLFVGCKLNTEEFTYIDIRTGHSINGGKYGSESERITTKRRELLDIWEGNSHPTSEELRRLSSLLSPSREYNKYYFIYWASTIPLIKLDWLDWAFDEGYLSREELERVESIVLSRSIQADVELPAPLGVRKEENLLRVIAILKWALLDPELKNIPFVSQEALAEWIFHSFLGTERGRSELSGKGLAVDTLGRTFADASKVLSKKYYDNRGQ
jgi:hypothetical protein